MQWAGQQHDWHYAGERFCVILGARNPPLTETTDGWIQLYDFSKERRLSIGFYLIVHCFTRHVESLENCCGSYEFLEGLERILEEF